MPLARLVSVLALAALWSAAAVFETRAPDGGIQPQVSVDPAGAVHMVYFTGDPKQGDVFYVRSGDWGETWSAPIRVNSQAGSAIAAGSIRGPKMSLGRAGRVHVAWNGSSVARPLGPLNPEMPSDSPYNGLPMLYARLNDAGDGFEPQRNLMRKTFGLDGGGSVAADERGNVYVAWHGKAPGAAEGEAGRRVWLVRSTDDGAAFRAEEAVSGTSLGSCACCGLELHAGRDGAVAGLFRSAREMVHRDVYLLTSADGARAFQEALVDEWEIGACPASSMALTGDGDDLVGAWETRGQVLFAPLAAAGRGAKAIAAPGEGKRRKYPALARNQKGHTILLWTQDGAWGRGGSLVWQVFDSAGEPTGDHGLVEKIEAWNFGAAFARPNGDFVVIY